MRPLNLGETLDASFKVVRRSWKTLAAVMLILTVPVQVLDVIITSATTDTYKVATSVFGLSVATSDTTYDHSGAYAAGVVALLVLSLLSYLVATAACYRAVADTYGRRPASVAASLRFAAHRLGPTVWLGLLTGLGLAAGLVVFVIPGVFLLIAWSVAFPVLFAERVGAPHALGRSLSLVQGRWWATCGRLVVALVIASVVSAVVGSVVLAPVSDDTSFAALVLSHVASVLGSLITTPLLVAVTTFVYIDLRLRKEGVDPLGAGGPSGDTAQAPERDAFGDSVVRWEPPVAPEPLPPPGERGD